MWPRLAVVASAGLLLSACGGDEGKGSDDRAGARATASAAVATPAGPCPEGTDPVRARDVIGEAPQGYEILSGDQKAIATFVKQFRRPFGAAWRGYDAKVLARRGTDNGTAVIVINSNERSGGSDDVLAGAEAAKRDRGTDYERIRIGGEEGPLSEAPDGAFIAVAPTGTCALVVLVADSEKLVRTVASLLPPR